MKNIVFYLFLLTFFTSCFRERVDIDNNKGDNKRMVISAWLTSDDRPQQVFVSHTINYFGNDEVETLSNASVTISDSQATYTLEETADGTYTLVDGWNPIVGENYTLRVLVEGTEYTATQLLRACPEIENPRHAIIETVVFNSDTINTYAAIFDIQETPGLGDGYYGSAYKKGYTARDSFINGVFVEDSFEDGIYWPNLELLVEDQDVVSGDTVVIEIQSLGEEAVFYVEEISNEIFRDELFGGPPANIRSNFDGGALGYFIFADVRTAEIVIE